MANVTYTVLNKNGSYDGDMVVKQYTSMTINAGDTVTVDQPCRGLFIYVQGNCTINGTLSMKGKGALANPTSAGASDNNTVNSNGLRLGLYTSTGTSTLTNANTLFNGCGTAIRTAITNQPSISGNGDILQIVRDGGTGSIQSGYSLSTPVNGANGNTISNGTGGGGAGGIWANINEGTISSGKSGTCFSGGSGGGGANFGGSFDGSSYNYCNAYDYAGAGGHGRSGHTARCTGGAGNPNGTESTFTGYNGVSLISNNESGAGGIIWLIVGGNLVIGASGIITAQGSRTDGLNANGYNWCSTGGGSGGGAIRIGYRGTLTNNGTITASGGVAGTYTGLSGGTNYSANGGNGGAGSVQTIQIK